MNTLVSGNDGAKKRKVMKERTQKGLLGVWRNINTELKHKYISLMIWLLSKQGSFLYEIILLGKIRSTARKQINKYSFLVYRVCQSLWLGPGKGKQRDRTCLRSLLLHCSLYPTDGSDVRGKTVLPLDQSWSLLLPWSHPLLTFFCLPTCFAYNISCFSLP